MYYPSSENKGADQLRRYREADLRLCFRPCRLLVFPCGGSNSINAKVITLKTKMNNMDTKFATNEKACDFVAKEFENNKTEIESAKDDLKDLLLLVFVLTPKVGTPRDHLVKRRLKSS